MELDKRPLRWGICGSGRVCHDFVTALKSLPEQKHEVYAVGDSESFLESAKKFAEQFGIRQVYGSFESIADDPNVDIFYCGVVNNLHYPLAKMLLEKKRNVLVEKPLTTRKKMAEELISIAQKNDVFFAEAMWMKMFPAFREAMRLVEEGKVGTVKSVSARAGFVASKYNTRLVDPKLWGGAIADVGCYTLHFVARVFGSEEPEEMKVVSSPLESGVDETTVVTLKFKGGRFAVLYTTFGHKVPCDAVVCGTEGYVTLMDPIFWASLGVKTQDGLLEFPLPPKEKFINKMNQPHSEGLVYEIEEVYECLREGRKESLLSPHKESVFVAGLIDRIWNEIGYKAE